MKVVIVDWRASTTVSHSTRAWAAVAQRSGRRPIIVTLPGADLEGEDVIGIDRPWIGGYSLHNDLVRLASEYIEHHVPSVVVLQNYVIPHEERRVAEAAKRVGARLVIVAHADRPGAFTWGSSVGLSPLLERADVLVAHSRFVAERLRPTRRQRVVVVPLPPPQVMDGGWSVAAAGSRRPPADPRVALHLCSRWSLTERRLVRLVARRPPNGWTISRRHLPARPTAVEPGRNDRDTLLRELAGASALLVPRRRSLQSASVVLAQALGTVPVVSGFGALPEQVGHGSSGLVVPRRAGPEHWREALSSLDDPERRHQLAQQCLAKSADDAETFERVVADLVR